MTRNGSGAAAVVWAALTIVVGSAVAGCGGGDEASLGAAPRVDLIDDALDAVTREVGGVGGVGGVGEPVELLEVSATLEHVDVIVQDSPGHGVLYRMAGDAEFSGPIEPRVDTRDTFTVADVTIDANHIFDRVRDELADPAIIDVAMRVDGGALVIDATVASESGGVLLVLLGADGSVLGSQAS